MPYHTVYLDKFTVEQVKKQFPILSLYEDDWPSRDMISTYLSNASSGHLRKDVEQREGQKE